MAVMGMCAVVWHNLPAGSDVYAPFPVSGVVGEPARGRGIVATVTGIQPQIKAGRARGLAVTTPKRSAMMPDLPTMAEAGLPGYAITLWIAVFGPAGMPPAVTARLNKEINRVLTMAEVRDQMAAQGSEVAPGAPADLLAAVKTDLKRMGEIVKAAKIQPE
jgi:tripartite-type tricarboxylate transporter receptor subunit TctC